MFTHKSVIAQTRKNITHNGVCDYGYNIDLSVENYVTTIKY